MLNELLIAEHGARLAGIEMAQRHPDIKAARRIPTLLVCLDQHARVAAVRPIPREVTPWTLRDAQHNSFPFIQPKQPLWALPKNDKRVETILDRQQEGRRRAILALSGDIGISPMASRGWLGEGLLRRLRERRQELASLQNTEGIVVLATIDRFIEACGDGKAKEMLCSVADKLLAGIRQSAGIEWVDVAAAVLVRGDGALLIEAVGEWPGILESKVIARVSAALRTHATERTGSGNDHCGLSGELCHLVEGKFPQPNLPLLGQTYLFARNKDTPANGRYGRFSADSMPVGRDTAIRLAAAVEALTAPELRGITWRAIPGEAAKESDLLLAFVEVAATVPVVAMLAEEDTEDPHEDWAAEDSVSAATSVSGTVGAFEKRTERLLGAVRAEVGADFRRTPVRLAVLRKVDPANRKVIFSGSVTVDELCRAAINWRAGERNVPEWFTLPVFWKGAQKPRPTQPLHVAPLGLVAFSRALFVRGGTQRQEVIGLPAAEAFEFFLDGDLAQARRVLQLLLTRRFALVSGTAHALRRGFEFVKNFDRREGLRTVTLLGVVLRKLGEVKEVYMNDPAFKLGQLLAAADVVHAGYCADVRGGDLPPSLLGNQVFSLAQTAPTKALAILCRRWKPYEGWARKAVRERDRIEKMRLSKDKDQQQRGWEILKALRHARQMGPLADALASRLGEWVMNDTFRAKLLLGYIAGLPKSQKDDGATDKQPALSAEED